jgi:hypothetical protein
MAVGWTVVIMGLCWLPGQVVNELESGAGWFKLPNLDKLVHAWIFVVFSILWSRVWPSRYRFARIALAGLGLAILTELVQTVPILGRDGNVADAIADGAGILVGIAVAPLIEPVFRYVEDLFA